MKFRIIEGGLSAQCEDVNPATKERAIRAEAERRLKALGYENHRVRWLATGEPIPRPLQYLNMQIAWVAERLLKTNPIPDDYHDDKYWPSAEGF